MKKINLLLIVLFAILLSSCYRSQFSTTTRNIKNGKVTYVNKYSKKRSITSIVKSPKSQPKKINVQNLASASDRTEVKYQTVPEITSDNNILITNSIDLLASTSNKPIINNTNKILINSDNHKNIPINGYFRGTIYDSIADTIKRKTPSMTA